MGTTFIIIGIIIVAVVLIITLLVTKKAYQYKHTIDAPKDNPSQQDQPDNNQTKDL
jgi:uncharacterized protein YpmB